MIDQDTIDQVRSSTTLSVLIGERVKLQKRGRSATGLCPFHKEKTPSFHVNDERGFYHCFGCQASGDAIKFIQETEGLSFVEAIRDLAERAGISIVENISDADRRQREEARRRKDELFEVGNAAAAFFEECLRTAPCAELAQAEILRRGLDVKDELTKETMAAFRLGYAPYAWDGLGKHLRKIGMSHTAAEKVGLLSPRRSGGGHFDKFRHRLMFAVTDLRGRVIAFSGRALDEPDDAALREHSLERMGRPGEEPAKYMNSPESPVYQKRAAVFGLYQARDAVRREDRCIMVEGNFDVVSLHARGIRNVVAPLGTAFTPEQAAQVKRYTQNITLLFAGDKAGRRATKSARSPVLDCGLIARVGRLPDGKDPDDLIRERGVDGLKACIDGAKSLLEHLIESALDSGFSADDAQARAAKINEVTELIREENDPALRAMAEAHADRIAERLGIADARTLRALSQKIRSATRFSDPENDAGPQAPRAEPPHRARSHSPQGAVSTEIFGALLDFPALLEDDDLQDALALLEGDLALAVATLRTHRGPDGSLDVTSFLESLAEKIRRYAAARLAAPRHTDIDSSKIEAQLNLEKLKVLDGHRLKNETLQELERAAASGELDEELTLLREQAERARRRRGLS